MSGSPCDERVEEEKGQEPKDPIQLDGVKDDKDKGQERGGIEKIGNNEENKEENKEETIKIGKGSKKVWLCGICRTMANKGSVKCMGCMKWIHRRYVMNKQNCSGLNRGDEYKWGIWRCQNCVDHAVKRKGPGRPAKPKNAEKIGTQRRQKIYASGIPMIKRGKRKVREVGSPEKHKGIGKKDEKSPTKKKSKTDGNKDEDNEELSDKAKKASEKCLISCGGANLNQADMESLEDKRYVTDEIILFFMEAILEYMKSQTSDKISVVGPSVAHLMQKHYDKREIDDQKKGMKLNEHDWVIFPINDKDDPDKGDGGTHWSLIVYNRKDNVYLYFDPIKGMNVKHARALHLNLLDSNSYQSYDNNGRISHYLPPLVEMNCQRQANGYDCGIFIMAFMATIMENIVSGRKVDDNKNVPYKADELRQLLLTALKLEIDRRNKNYDKRNIIDLIVTLKESKNKKEKERANEEKMEKEKAEKEKEIFENALRSLCNPDASLGNMNNANNKEEINAKKVDNVRNNNGNDKRNKTLNRGRRSRSLCKFFERDGCRNGRNCKFEHPEICNEWYEHGRCKGVNGECEKAHPNICRKYIKREPCTYSDCLYMHPRGMKKANHREEQNDTQRHSERKHNRGRNDNNFRGYNKFFHHE